MQGNERFHLCLLTVDTDVPPALRIHPDMVGMQKHYIHIRQSGQARKDESLSCQFHPLVIHRGGKYLLELLTTDIPVSCLRFGFILQALAGGGTRIISLLTVRYNRRFDQRRQWFVREALKFLHFFR